MVALTEIGFCEDWGSEGRGGKGEKGASGRGRGRIERGKKMPSSWMDAVLTLLSAEIKFCGGVVNAGREK